MVATARPADVHVSHQSLRSYKRRSTADVVRRRHPIAVGHRSDRQLSVDVGPRPSLGYLTPWKLEMVLLGLGTEFDMTLFGPSAKRSPRIRR